MWDGLDVWGIEMPLSDEDAASPWILKRGWITIDALVKGGWFGDRKGWWCEYGQIGMWMGMDGHGHGHRWSVLYLSWLKCATQTRVKSPLDLRKW